MTPLTVYQMTIKHVTIYIYRDSIGHIAAHVQQENAQRADVRGPNLLTHKRIVDVEVAITWLQVLLADRIQAFTPIIRDHQVLYHPKDCIIARRVVSGEPCKYCMLEQPHATTSGELPPDR